MAIGIAGKINKNFMKEVAHAYRMDKGKLENPELLPLEKKIEHFNEIMLS